MSEPFLGQIMLVGFNYQPRGWAFCDGRLLTIAQNTALYSLLGTTYGGNGTSNFALPDLRGRVAIGMGQSGNLSNYQIGQQAGTETVTLSIAQMPTHNHNFTVDASAGATTVPGGGNIALVNTGGRTTPNLVTSYTSGNPAGPVTLNASTVQNQGSSQPHTNIQPSLALNYIIALQGIFPARN